MTEKFDPQKFALEFIEEHHSSKYIDDDGEYGECFGCGQPDFKAHKSTCDIARFLSMNGYEVIDENTFQIDGSKTIRVQGGKLQ
jgi:hypothetical protein